MLKRTIDIAVSATALVVLLPVMIVVAVLVRLFLGAPVLFVQPRPGQDGRIFDLYKFRTMHNTCGPDGAPLSDEERMSSFGNLLRTLSLDELPQLWNVLKGEMSLVGPRPLRVEYLDLYTPEQARRHEVRPGITGLAQVSGRNDLSFEERFKLDVRYVDHHSLALDLEIMGKTVVKLLRPEGVIKEGYALGGETFTGTAAPQANNDRKGLDKAA